MHLILIITQLGQRHYNLSTRRSADN